MTSLSTLSTECAELLRVAAVIGRSFDIDVLATVVDRAPLECLDLLGEAGRLSLVEPDGGPGRHRFVETTVQGGFSTVSRQVTVCGCTRASRKPSAPSTPIRS